jgi:phosphoglycerate dehydrogenase-like enzyme
MNTHRLLIYHRDARIYEEIIRKRVPELSLRAAVRPEEALPFIEEAEILFSSWRIPDEVLRRARRLRWFASTFAGNETLVTNPLLPEPVIITKTTLYGEMMAEYVFAYLLSSMRNVPQHQEDQERRVWNPVRPGRLQGKIMGILGLGSVGKVIAERGKQFGMNILGVKRTPEPVENVDEIYGPEELKRMIPRVDYLIVVLPLTPGTHHFLKEPEIRMLKDGAILFSIGRGKTIEEEALIRVLKTRKIRAVLDVFETEPLPPESELWGIENVVVTPHVSGISLPEEVGGEFIANYERWVKGEPLLAVVDRRKGY